MGTTLRRRVSVRDVACGIRFFHSLFTDDLFFRMPLSGNRNFRRYFRIHGREEEEQTYCGCAIANGRWPTVLSRFIKQRVAAVSRPRRASPRAVTQSFVEPRGVNNRPPRQDQCLIKNARLSAQREKQDKYATTALFIN